MNILKLDEAIITGMDIAPPIITNLYPQKPKMDKKIKSIKTNT